MIASLSDVSKQSARQRIDCFVQRFDDSYRKLTYYAALPLLLTPELLNYLRNQFLRGEVPWVAEIDLLLSDLCSPTGYEQYVMDTAVRAVLLEEMDRVLGQDRMEAVARLLINYVRKLARTTPHLGERSLQAQQWAAMVYLDDQRQTAVQQIARALQDAVQDATTTGQAESQAGLPAANQAELAQLARITQELAPQLGRYTNLLDYAKVVSQLLVAPTSASSEMLERSYSVEGIELRLPVVGQRPVKIAQPKVEGQSGNRLGTRNKTPKTILLLAANPKGTTPLRLDEEVREIDAGLQRAKHRDQFVLEQKWAVRPRDIQRAMLDINPSIVHFSGHGTGDEGLVFEDETGRARLVDGEALAGLFDLFADRVECVVLNGCYSEVQATAIARHVNYVIGMKKAIGDRAAIEFAVGFYDALGAGRSVEFAHKFGCAAIRLAGIPEQLTPTLKKKPNIRETVTRSKDQSSVLNQDKVNALADLLIISQKAKAREALCIKIGISYYKQLGFIYDSSDSSFAINLIDHLNEVGNRKAICQLCCQELLPIFQGKNKDILKQIAEKLNCNNDFSLVTEFGVNDPNQLDESKPESWFTKIAKGATKYLKRLTR